MYTAAVFLYIMGGGEGRGQGVRWRVTRDLSSPIAYFDGYMLYTL